MSLPVDVDVTGAVDEDVAVVVNEAVVVGAVAVNEAVAGAVRDVNEAVAEEIGL